MYMQGGRRTWVPLLGCGIMRTRQWSYERAGVLPAAATQQLLVAYTTWVVCYGYAGRCAYRGACCSQITRGSSVTSMPSFAWASKPAVLCLGLPTGVLLPPMWAAGPLRLQRLLVSSSLLAPEDLMHQQSYLLRSARLPKARGSLLQAGLVSA